MATNKDQALLIEVDPSRANHILYLPGILKLSLERGWNFVWNSLELNYLESISGYLEHTFLHKGDHYPSSSFSFLNKLACHWVFQEAGVEYNKLIVEKHLWGKEQNRAALAGRAIRLMQTWHGASPAGSNGAKAAHWRRPMIAGMGRPLYSDLAQSLRRCRQRRAWHWLSPLQWLAEGLPKKNLTWCTCCDMAWSCKRLKTVN